MIYGENMPIELSSDRPRREHDATADAWRALRTLPLYRRLCLLNLLGRPRIIGA